MITSHSRHFRNRSGPSLSIDLLAVLLLFSAVLLVGCGGSKASSDDGVSVGNGGPDELFGETASFEVIAGKPQRVMVGMGTADGRVLHGGSVTFTFRSPDDANADAVSTTATYLPVPGSPSLTGNPTIGRPSEGIGVYAATEVTLPVPGVWTIDVQRSGTKSTRLAQTAVEVLEKAKAADVGARAPSTDNPVDSSPVARELLDSRSGRNGMGTELPDPALHTKVINDLVRDKVPFVVVVSTPAYCQSKFCGPITDLIDSIAKEPASKDVAFVHLEVFAKFGGADTTELNRWVIPWINGEGDGHEPWVFVVDRTGKITDRFDNLVDENSLRSAIAVVSAS